MARHRSRSGGKDGEGRRVSRSVSSRRRRSSPSPSRASKKKTPTASSSSSKRRGTEKSGKRSLSPSPSPRLHRSKRRADGEKRRSVSPLHSEEADGGRSATKREKAAKASFRSAAPPKGLSSRGGRRRSRSRSLRGAKDLRKSKSDPEGDKARNGKSEDAEKLHRKKARRSLSRSPAPAAGADDAGGRRQRSRSRKASGRGKSSKGRSESPPRSRERRGASRSRSPRARDDGKKGDSRRSPESARRHRRRHHRSRSPRRSPSISRSRSFRRGRASPSVQRHAHHRDPWSLRHGGSRHRGVGGAGWRRSKSRSVSRSRSNLRPYSSRRRLSGGTRGAGSFARRGGGGSYENDFMAALPPDHPFASRPPPKHSTTPLLPPLSQMMQDDCRGPHSLYDPRGGSGRDSFWGADRGRPAGGPDRLGPNARWVRGEALPDDALPLSGFPGARRDPWADRGRGVIPRGNSPLPAFFQERLMMRRKMMQDAEIAGAVKEQKRALRRTLKPALVVDRATTPPFLLRVFYKVDDQHSVEQFQERGQEPVEDELQVYAWMDSKLREIAYLVKDVCWEARDRHAVWKFRLVYPDKKGKNVVASIGLLHSTIPDPKEDSKTLADVKFQIGDFLLLSIVKEKKDAEDRVLPRTGLRQTRTTAEGWEQVVQDSGSAGLAGPSSMAEGDAARAATTKEEAAHSVDTSKAAALGEDDENAKEHSESDEEETKEREEEGDGDPETFPDRQRYTAPDHHTDDDEEEERKDSGEANSAGEEEDKGASHAEASAPVGDAREAPREEKAGDAGACSDAKSKHDVRPEVEKGSAGPHADSPQESLLPPKEVASDEEGKPSSRSRTRRDEEKDQKHDGEKKEKRRSARLGKKRAADA
ncbi:Sin3-associated polypeptide SAP18 [Besnoitia besnoiti]|uniref:Sin3-associated polypeptide SAP18 n=1 Tax=Besnoitia besnoiti TaxID=94643 RepID=A0A2A9M472_BESBE|nr:Sin3-associated polypeptide SAP18 [Besnoitia besnoiti]PFH32749.1 Sin3-associated polypeptide SAP18 [Besnoitia besnoiti]